MRLNGKDIGGTFSQLKNNAQQWRHRNYVYEAGETRLKFPSNNPNFKQ